MNEKRIRRLMRLVRLMPIYQKAVHAQMDRDYRANLDQPIVALKGKTPRQVVKTAAGRKMVVARLRLLETGTARADTGAMTGYYFGWMWTELGVTREG